MTPRTEAGKRLRDRIADLTTHGDDCADCWDSFRQQGWYEDLAAVEAEAEMNGREDEADNCNVHTTEAVAAERERIRAGVERLRNRVWPEDDTVYCVEVLRLIDGETE